MASSETVIVVNTGAANIASVCAALKRCSTRPELSSSKRAVKTARRLVLPGVGAFGSVMSRLSDLGLAPLLRERIEEGRPTLAICLGLHALAKKSEESPGVPGLGVIDGTVTRFGPAVRVPQLGWNGVRAAPGSSFLNDGSAYFANSFRLRSIPPEWKASISDHGGPFVAGLEKGSVLACQFHPELSGRWGHNVMARWLTAKAVG